MNVNANQFSGTTADVGRTIQVTDSGVKIYGSRVVNGEPQDFTGFIARNYTDLARATGAARRKYNDATINVLKIERFKVTYTVPVNKISEISIATEREIG